MSSKGPQALQQLTKGTPYEAHRDYTSASSSSSLGRPTTSFRTAPPGTGGFGTDEDFGRFASGSGSGSSSHSRSLIPQSLDSAEITSREAGEAGTNAIFDLLSSGQFTDQVQGSWEMDLMMDQATPWKIQQGVAVPRDPEASTSINHQTQAVISTSATSSLNTELETSISSLDPASLSYLKTLLALPEPECIQDYLSQNRYTSDIYGLPQIEKLFELAAGKEEGSTVEEGRVRAVRRLGMVMEHLWGEEFLNQQKGATTSVFGAEGGRTMERVRSTGNGEWDEDNAARSSYSSLINGNTKGKGKALPSHPCPSGLDTSPEHQYLSTPTQSSHRSASPSHNSYLGTAANGGSLDRGDLAGHTDGSRSGKDKEVVPIPFQIL